ncbi:glycosyltransferase family 25 protein [Paracoccus sp. p3-h83]
MMTGAARDNDQQAEDGCTNDEVEAEESAIVRGQRIIPLRALQRAMPYSRNARRRGSQLLPVLRRQLLKDPIDTIDEVEFRVARCIAIQAGTTDVPRTMKVANALSARFGKEMVQGPLAQALVHLRDVDKARQLAIRNASADSDSVEGEEHLARLAMLDGDPAAGLLGYRHTLKAACSAGDTRVVRRCIDILIEGGEFDWLRQHAPADLLAQSRLAQSEALAAPDGTLPILCLNLDKDANRYETTAAMLGGGGTLDRVPGVLGSLLPVSQRRRLLGDAEVVMSAAEIGCALSHVAAWERVAARADDDYAVVVEDDARFIYGPGRGTVELLAAARAAQADLVFVNWRACLAAIRQQPLAAGAPPALFPVDGAFAPETMMTNPGWGGDGYLISGRGARALVEAWRETGLLGALDWQMCLMCLARLPEAMRISHTAMVFDALTRRGTWPVLPGFTTNLPIIHTRDFGFSAINAG